MDFHPLIQCTPQQFVVNAEPYNLRRHLTVGPIHKSTGTAPFEPTTGQKPRVALLATARIAPGFFRTRSRFIRHRRRSGSFQLKPLRGC